MTSGLAHRANAVANSGLVHSDGLSLPKPGCLSQRLAYGPSARVSGDGGRRRGRFVTDGSFDSLMDSHQPKTGRELT